MFALVDCNNFYVSCERFYKLNRTFKADKIKLANQDLQRTWKMRQERLSPKYTTNIKDILTVK